MSDDRRWLDGKQFFQWAWQERPYLVHGPDAVPPLPGRLNASLFSERVVRSIHRWKRGGTVDSYGRTCEEFLMALDLAEWEIPDEIWTDPPKRTRLTADDRYAIKVMARNGLSVREISDRMGISDRTVRTYS